MGKYAELGRCLRERARDQVPMTFTEIEQVLGMLLPPSAQRHRSWWSNNLENNVATREWVDAGYITEQVDIQHRRLVFRRRPASLVAEPAATWTTSVRVMGETEAPQEYPLLGDQMSDPLFGALKGTVYIPPGVDLTEPADPEWGNLWGDYGDE